MDDQPVVLKLAEILKDNIKIEDKLAVLKLDEAPEPS